MKKILIVEDESFTALWLYQNLTDQGFDVLDPCATSQEAVKTARESRPDIILMNIQLSGRPDGIQTARELQAGPGRLDSRLIFITGFSPLDVEKDLADIHYHALISKPLDMKELIQSLQL